MCFSVGIHVWVHLLTTTPYYLPVPCLHASGPSSTERKMSDADLRVTWFPLCLLQQKTIQRWGDSCCCRCLMSFCLDLDTGFVWEMLENPEWLFEHYVAIFNKQMPSHINTIPHLSGTKFRLYFNHSGDSFYYRFENALIYLPYFSDHKHIIIYQLAHLQ